MTKNAYFGPNLAVFGPQIQRLERLDKVNNLKSKLYLQVGGPEQDQDEHVLYIQ